MQLAVSEGMSDVYVALGQLRRTSPRRALGESVQAIGLTGRALVGALVSINPDRVTRGIPA